ncbi:dihydropteroate synthase [Metarhizium album ARSEF 1941]|uniref:Dihydropteroate synthase n=1 Tax=Metarhizium album (strain ARSEF 1941) TaxID=1081103 RepID=A0A0B2X3L4_METAS|nr:dihydropteroate synthase [Metarhizium album ARSEF 1941]KHO00015.1 dihydropteroate synthase [Metarhizium album ARSEF 1941]
MAVPISTSHGLLLAAGEPPATVRVQNIRSTIQGPSDAWGRQGRPQPISISVTVGMAKAFGPTSSADALASDTVHYGLLAKAVLATLTRLDGRGAADRPPTLPAVLDSVWTDLTGATPAGTPASPAGGPPFLKLESIRSLQVELRLPKATLQGDGVRLTAAAVFAHGAMAQRGIRLSVCDLRIPILIGVNPNERRARQAVVANVDVDRFDDPRDSYSCLEGVIATAMTGSSFETVEALLADVAAHVAAYLAENHAQPADGGGWQLRVAVEKPIAVVSADGPCVELRVNTNDVLVTNTKGAASSRQDPSSS